MVQQYYLEILKHMCYVGLFIIVVFTVAYGALPENYFQLLSMFCFIENAGIEIVHNIPYLIISFS